MTPEQEKNIEQKLIELCGKFEKWSANFAIALENVDTKKTGRQLHWFMPRSMFLRLLRVTAAASGPELKTACVALHGAVDCLGFQGTLKLILDLRRNYATREKTKIQRKNGAVPGVRHGNSTDAK